MRIGDVSVRMKTQMPLRPALTASPQQQQGARSRSRSPSVGLPFVGLEVPAVFLRPRKLEGSLQLDLTTAVQAR